MTAPGRAFSNRSQQFLLDDPVMGELVLGHMDNHNRNLECGKILPVLKAAVDGHQHVEFLLGNCQEWPVLQRIPSLLVDGGDCMVTEERLDARIYALVNEDAHSSNWLLAKSSTARTCSRVIGG